MTKTNMITVIFALIMLCAAPSFPQSDLSSEIYDPELEQEFKWLKAETYVITASRVRENIKKAPASISVISQKQMRQMGAKHLADVLKRAVPGVGVYNYFLGFNTFPVRGMQPGLLSNKLLIMINSHPVNQIQTGGASLMFDTLVTDNIKRIEIIRGPGSAMYGENAYSGVVNVITKDAADIDGFEITALGGTYDTQQYNLLYGKTFSELEVAFNFNYFKTHGFRGIIEEDYQTYIDGLWPPPFPDASFAPGRMAGNDEKYDAHLTMKYKGLKLDGRYIEREKEYPVGWVAALNQKSEYNPKTYYVNLTYSKALVEELELSVKVYRNHFELPAEFQFFPPGHVHMTTAGPLVMTDGMWAESSFKDNQTGLEIQTTYRTNDCNTLVVGATYEKMKEYDFWIRENHEYFIYPEVINYLDPPEKSNVETQRRTLKAIFIEDIWDITDDIRLTAGVRYDWYSDFGDEVSPRVGLTWEYMHGYDLKLLYGHAFRAPSFYELYDRLGGNPDLDAEKIDSFEISLGAEFTPSFNGRLTFYHRQAEDLIITPAEPPWDFFNHDGSFRDQGFEVEAKYDLGKGTYVAANYNYRSWKTEDARGYSPKQSADIMANIRFSRYLNLYADCNIWDEWNRTSEDSRDNASGAAIVNLTLIAKKFLKGYEGLELRGSAYNLLDKDYVSPQPENQLPNDLPMPGRNYRLEMKYSF